MPSKKKITITDVAACAGVSPATVSRVLSGRDHVNEETKLKVAEAVEKTGYLVSAPKTKPFRNILVICSSLRDQGSSYFLEGIERRADESGYTPLIKHIMMSQLIHKNPKAEDMITWAKDCNASGLLIFSDAVDTDEIDKAAAQMPVSTMMTEYSDQNISSVDVDEADMMRKCFTHLMSTGKIKIALITGQPKYRRSMVLKNIYLSLLKEMQMEINPDWLANIDTNYYSTSAAIAARQMLTGSNPPDAFIATADIFAAGVIYACNQLGLQIPEDVAVVGRDNSSVDHISIPQITAFNMPADMIGYTACNNLIARIEEPECNIRNIILPCDLIIRESTTKHFFSFK